MYARNLLRSFRRQDSGAKGAQSLFMQDSGIEKVTPACYNTYKGVGGMTELKYKLINKHSVSPDTEKQEQINRDIKFWKEIDRLAEESNDEVLSMDNFLRSKFSRELITFDDDEV